MIWLGDDANLDQFGRICLKADGGFLGDCWRSKTCPRPCRPEPAHSVHETCAKGGYKNRLSGKPHMARGDRARSSVINSEHIRFASRPYLGAWNLR